jgi:hypothetical protein
VQIGLTFPRVDAQPSSQAIIDLSQYSYEQLREVQDATQWPVVIRLECVTEAGLEQGHSLSVCHSRIALQGVNCAS